MKCNLIRSFLQTLRFMIFPESKKIAQRTKEIDHELEELQRTRVETVGVIKRVNQPDVLRSLVISMNRTTVGGRK